MFRVMVGFACPSRWLTAVIGTLSDSNSDVCGVGKTCEAVEAEPRESFDKRFARPIDRLRRRRLEGTVGRGRRRTLTMTC